MKIDFKHQREDIETIRKHNGIAYLALDMGLGKAQPLDSKVLTPYGWTFIGELKVGDYVIGSDGKKKRVKGVYPQGKKKVYSVETRDGGKVRTTSQHLWATNSASRNKRGLPLVVRTLKEIKNDLKEKNGNCKHYLPIVKPVEFEKRNVKLDPYLMGYLIANGCFTENGTPKVTMPDLETVERIRKLLPKGITLEADSKIDYRMTSGRRGVKNKNKVTKYLRELGLYGKQSYYKFIPTDYLYTDINSRIEFLQGLMDGDGSVSCKDNHVEYSSSSHRLTKRVQELIRSLGGVARLYEKKKVWYTHKGIKKKGERHWRVSIVIPDGITPFKLSRKANVYSPKQKYKPSRAITNVKYIGKKECVCISIESEDGLYVAKDYVLTHNTSEACQYRKKYGPFNRPIIIVCPASLKINWKRECKMWGFKKIVFLESQTPFKEKPSKELRNSSTVFIINYDIIQYWEKWLKRLKAGTVFIDEAQFLSNRSSKRTKSVMKLCQNIPCRIGMSGTPLTNSPADLWPMLNILWPEAFPSFLAYAGRYCKKKNTPWGPKYHGVKNGPELHARLKELGMIRRLKEDTIEMKRKDIFVLPIELNPKQRKKYNSMVKDYQRWLRGAAPHMKASTLTIKGLSKKNVIKMKTAILRRNDVKKWVQKFLNKTDDKKLIVFGIHHKMLEFLHKKFPGSIIVNGKMSGAEKDRRFERFKRRDECRLLFGNIKSAGTGLNAVECQDVLFAEIGWQPAEIKQAMDRVYRIGQKKNVRIYFMLAKDTIEHEIYKLSQTKQGYSDEIIDGTKSVNRLPIHTMIDNYLLGGNSNGTASLRHIATRQRIYGRRSRRRN